MTLTVHSPMIDAARLQNFALGCAAIALLIAPFRSSAGTRGGLLLLALLAILWCWRVRALPAMYPVQGQRGLFAALGSWLVVVAMFSLLGPDPAESMVSWRGDVFTPILTGGLFFALNRSRLAAGILLIALFAGLLVLAAMVVADPAQPLNFRHAPSYVSVGWLSTWVVVLAALVPFCWLVDWPKPTWAAAIGGVSVVALVVASWFTANRLVWLCFAGMMLIYALMNTTIDRRRRTRQALVLLGALIAMAMLFWGASAQRHNEFKTVAPDAFSFMLQDNRVLIWKESVALIAERPLIGHGFALESGKRALADRFSDPGFGLVFRQAHNILMNYAIQIGLFGALVLLWVYAALGNVFWQSRRDSLHARAVASCGLMLVAGFFFRNMFDDFISRHAILLFAAMVGFLLAATQWPKEFFRPDDAAR